MDPAVPVELIVMGELFACAVRLAGSWSPMASASLDRLLQTVRRQAHRVGDKDLDPEDRRLLRRAQRAADSVLASAVYEDGLLDRDAANAELAQREWVIAVEARKLSALRARRPQTVSGHPVPADVRDQLRAHIQQEIAAEQPALALIEAFENLAFHVEFADTPYEEFLQAEAAADREDQARERIVSIVTRTRQANAIENLEQQADAIFDTLRELDEQCDHRLPPRPGKRAR